jgi:hypothetical protein
MLSSWHGYIERRSRVSGTFATCRTHPEAELDPR